MYLLYKHMACREFWRIKVFGEIEKNSNLYFICTCRHVHTYNNTTPEKNNIREKRHLADRSMFFFFLCSVLYRYPCKYMYICICLTIIIASHFPQFVPKGDCRRSRGLKSLRLLSLLAKCNYVGDYFLCSLLNFPE